MSLSITRCAAAGRAPDSCTPRHASVCGVAAGTSGPDDHHLPQSLALRQHRRERAQAVGRGDQHAHIAVAQDVDDLFGLEQRIDRHEHRTCARVPKQAITSPAASPGRSRRARRARYRVRPVDRRSARCTALIRYSEEFATGRRVPGVGRRRGRMKRKLVKKHRSFACPDTACLPEVPPHRA